MARDTDLREGIKDWRRHAVAASITLIPLMLTAMVAWGVLSTKVDSAIAAQAEMKGDVRSLDGRVDGVEKTNAVVLQRLDDIKERQEETNQKLDRMYGR